MNWRIIESADGSHTLHSDELKESYHSRHGAVRESRYVFIEKGLFQFSPDATLNVLEIGFGTGLNALLTCMVKEGRNIRYTTLEPHPVPEEFLAQLNYAELVEEVGAQEVFQKLHEMKWGAPAEISEGFVFEKRIEGLLDFGTSEKFDLVYYDAFGFHAQPEMWQRECWVHLYNLMEDGGLWVSYCAKGEVRRGLSEAGFKVERLPGPSWKKGNAEGNQIKCCVMEKDIKTFNIRAYGILINEKGELLVSDEMIRGLQFTKFPGGGLEWGEGLIDCLKREFMEELNQPIEVRGHYYTTDYFQQSAFHTKHQLISVYFRVSIVGETVFQAKVKPFDFPEGHGTDDVQVFRWLPLEDIKQEDFRWPVDKIVAEMLQRDYKINSY